MANNNWGACKSCCHFEIEPEAKADDQTMGLCNVHQLETYHLRVSGASGCSAHEDGEVVHIAGASQVPPPGTN